MNPDLDQADDFLQALRQDLPSNEADDGMRSRLRAAGMVLAPTSVNAGVFAAATNAGTQVAGVGAATGAGAATDAGAMSLSNVVTWATFSGSGVAKLVGVAGVLAAFGVFTWQGKDEGLVDELPLAGSSAALLVSPIAKKTAEILPRASFTQGTQAKVNPGAAISSPAAGEISNSPAGVGKNHRRPKGPVRHNQFSAVEPGDGQRPRTAKVTLPGQGATQQEPSERKARELNRAELARIKSQQAVLGAEARLLHRALSALKQGDLQQTARHLEDHKRRFPQGVLLKERLRTQAKLSRALAEAQ